MERALEEYEKRKKKAEKDLEKLRSKYNKRLNKKVREILKRIDSLEKREVPKNVDENIKKIVMAEKKSYITSMRNVLGSIETVEDLGKRLPDLAKLHVGHGKYLLIIFEKEVYAINRLLKELNEDYLKYREEVARMDLGNLDIKELLLSRERAKRDLEKAEKEKSHLRSQVNELQRELDKFYEAKGLKELDNEIQKLRSKIKSSEIEIRSKASRLQKPIKRMRLHEGMADELVRDSSIAIRKPSEVIAFLQRVYPRLDGKYRKTAQWLIENLEKKVATIAGDQEKLSKLEKKKEEILSDAEGRRKEIRELERLIEEKESEIRKLKRQLEHLEKELEESLAKLEEILGQRIER